MELKFSFFFGFFLEMWVVVFAACTCPIRGGCVLRLSRYLHPCRLYSKGTANCYRRVELILAYSTVRLTLKFTVQVLYTV